MKKIWLNQYPEGIPAEIDPNRYSSLPDFFDHCFSEYKNCPMVSNMGHELSFNEIDKLSTNFASYCQNTLGLQKGDRFGIMMPNLIQYFVALFGALRAGLIVVNINPLYTERELAEQCNDAGVKALLVLENFAHTVQDALPNLSIEFFITTQIGDALPGIKKHIVNLAVNYIKKMVPKWELPNAHNYSEAILIGSTQQFNPIELQHTDLAFLQYTGGTTGKAKGAMLSHGNMVGNIMQSSGWIKPFTQTGKEIIITALPLYHIFSLEANCFTFMSFGALNVLITNPRDMKRFVADISKYKFTAMTGVNTLFNGLLNYDGFRKLDFSKFKLSLGGGMAVQRAVAERWKEVTGSPLLEAYGLTETCPAVCINPVSHKNYNGSIGLPLSSTDISIRDEQGEELGSNEVGELWIKGPQVMQGYWQQPEETKRVLTDDGWFASGDMAKVDEQGYVYIVDRKKDMILVSGFNVYPNEIEDVIAAHPDVIEVAVVGEPNVSTGEVVKAYIVKRNGDLTEENIIAYCREQLTPYKVPKLIEFAEELPKSNVGKILRRELKSQAKVKACA